MLIFDDESSNDWNRQKVLERLSQVTCRPDCSRRLGSDYSPVGQIYFYTLKSTNPQYDLMELKSLEDWTLEKQFKSVPNVVDVVSFGGTTREYQVRSIPDKLVSYGLSIARWSSAGQQQRQRGRQLHRAGLQQINVRAWGW
jgi:heavy metal efflux system protein